MRLPGEILCREGFTLGGSFISVSKNQLSGVCDSTAAGSSPQRSLNIPHAKAITLHNNGSKGDEVEVAGVANSQGVTTSGDEAQWEVCPPWWTLGKTIKMNCFS